MKKILVKFKHNTFFGFMLGILLCSGIIYAANYLATDVSYTPSDETWKVNNVNEAINSLYSIKQELDNIKSLGDATVNDIAKDKTAVVNGELITGTATTGMQRILLGSYNSSGAVTIDVTKYYDDYVNLTTNNFYIVPKSINYGGTATGVYDHVSFSITYSESSGKLQLSKCMPGSGAGGFQHYLTYDVYLIY